jgi:hypothetical protein
MKEEKRSASASRYTKTVAMKPHLAGVFPNFIPSIGSDQKNKLKLPSNSAVANLPSNHAAQQDNTYSVGSYGLGEITTTSHPAIF